MATLLHRDCVGCRARAMVVGVTAPLNGEEATVVILGMLVAGIPLDQIMNDLCFTHHKQVTDVALALAAERV